MSDLGPSSTALDLAAALRARELSALELLEACLAAVDERNPELNAVTWRDDEGARAAARAADERIAAGEEAPFLGVPIPIKDLTPVAGWPVTYGSHGASNQPSEESELVVESFQKAGFVLCGRTNTPEFGPLTVAENSRYGNTVNPWDTSRASGGSSGGALGRGGRWHVPGRPRQRRRRLDPHPGRLHRPGRPEDQPRADSAAGADLDGRRGRGRDDAHDRRHRGGARRDRRSRPARLVQRARAAAPFADEVGVAPGPLRIGTMAEAPLGIPTDPACVEATRGVAALLEELGHEVSEVEVPTVSEELIPPFVTMTAGGLADYDGVEWSKTEPHSRHAHEMATTKVSAYDYVAPHRRWRSSRAGRWSAGGATSTSC